MLASTGQQIAEFGQRSLSLPVGCDVLCGLGDPLGVYEVNPETELFAEIGVVLLLGVILPFAGGFLAAELAGGDLALAIFLAAALTATSVGITSNVLRDLGALTTQGGRIILGAAVIDDVLAIMILSVASGVAAGSFAITNVLSLLVVAILFIAVVVIGGTRILRRRRSILTDPEFAETPFLPGMIVMLDLAAVIGLAASIGEDGDGIVGEPGPRSTSAPRTCATARRPSAWPSPSRQCRGGMNGGRAKGPAFRRG